MTNPTALPAKRAFAPAATLLVMPVLLCLILFTIPGTVVAYDGICADNYPDQSCPSKCESCTTAEQSYDFFTACGSGDCPAGTTNIGTSNSGCFIGTIRNECRDECTQSTNECATCSDGYFGSTCDNECPGGVGILACNGNGVCSDGKLGDGSCSCYGGYDGDSCQFSDAVTCNGNGSVNSTGSCFCNTGYSGASCSECSTGYTADESGSCLDTNACLTNTCDVNAACTDLPPPSSGGSGRVCSCDSGYSGDGEPGNCAAVQALVTISSGGSGSGLVTSSPAGIDCGLDCSELFPYPTQVTLSAAPDSGSSFAGLSGDADCSDEIVEVNTSGDDINCTATFDLAACPVNSSGAPNCTCDSGYQGTLTWDATGGNWTGSCEQLPEEVLINGFEDLAFILY